MFRRHNRIILAAGIAIAVTAAMAGPAGARASAAEQASTPVPIDVTGDMTWTYSLTPASAGSTVTGAETQTGTFHIGLTNVAYPWAAAGGNSSTYSLTDNTDISVTDNQTGCNNTMTGTASRSGSLPYNDDNYPTSLNPSVTIGFNPSLTAASLLIYVPYTETQTTTWTGPSPCFNGTSAGTGTFLATPNCDVGILNVQGTYPNATVNLACSSAASSLGSWSITGTLTITPSCGSASSSSSAASARSGGGSAAAVSHAPGSQAAAVSACGLTITSPPDNSTIAISDPNPDYIDGSQIGPNDRAPALDMLKLKIAGTSAGCSGAVTVNGVAATSSGDDWSVEIPLMALATGGVGPVTLTATASGCSDATSTVTLINLEITNPTENEQEPIANLGDGGAPAMPALNAKVSVIGYPGDTSGESFGWTLDLRNETVARGTPPIWSPDDATITGSTTGTGQAWQPGNDQIVGGVGRLIVAVSLPGVLDSPVTSFPRWINVSGGPLGMAAVLAYLKQSSVAQYAGTVSQIFCVESRWQQFNKSSVNSKSDKFPPQPAIPNVPADWTPNPGTWQPIYGGPAGIGVAQYDPEEGTAPLEDYWNWQANADQGIAIFEDDLQQAHQLAAAEQDRLTGRQHAAIAAATANRAAIGNHTPPTVAPLVTVPQLTDEQIKWETVRLYNGDDFHEYHFNADYVLSANGLNVILVPVDPALPESWVGGTDPAVYRAPSSKAGSWVEPPPANLKKPMRWSAVGPIQSYDDQVRLCPALPA